MKKPEVRPVVLALGLLAAACSSADQGVAAVNEASSMAPEVTVVTVTSPSEPEVTVDNELPPPNTLYELDWSETWTTSEKRPSLAAEASPALVPVAGPSGQQAEITFDATSSGGQPAVRLVVRRDDTDAGIASLGITRDTAVDPLVCEAIRDGPIDAWVTIVSGSIEGCGSSNEVGFFFLRWHVDGDSYHFGSSNLGEQRSLEYLDIWEAI